MSGVNVAPFMGGILMNNAAWRSIPDRYKPQLLEISSRIERDVAASIASLERDAISTMVRYGLQINELTDEQLQVWYDDTARYENNLVGTTSAVFNRDYYMRIRNILTEYRTGR